MKTYQKTAFIVLIIIIGFIVQNCCRPPLLSSVGVNLKPQHTNCWCWAACTEMISEYYGHRILQHESSNYVHGTNCTDDCPGACPCWDYYGATINQIKDNWTHWNFEYKYSPTHLEWGEEAEYPIWSKRDYVRVSLANTSYCSKCPIYVIWWWYGGGGHVVVAYGYTEIGGQRYISYLNPWSPDCSRNTATCASAAGGDDVVTTFQAFIDDKMHHWEDTFYDFKYVGK
jgi:hypothetical protein